MAAGLDDGGQHLQGGNQPIAGRGVVAENDVPGLLAAEIAADSAHLLDHIAVADRCAMKPDALAGETALEAQIGHYRRHQRAAGEPIAA